MSIDYTNVVNAVMGVLDKRFNLNFEPEIIQNLKISLHVAINKSAEPLIAVMVNDIKASNSSAPVISGKKHKRPLTAYNLFTQEYQLTHPKEPELFKKAGAAWKLTTAAERAPFEQRANELAEQHVRAQAGGKNKRSPNSYNLFMSNYKKTHPDVANLFKSAGAAWRALDEEQRAVWVKQAESLRPRKNTRKGFLTGYNLFISANMNRVANEHPTWNNKACLRYVASKWHEANKSEWNIRAAAVNERRTEATSDAAIETFELTADETTEDASDV